MPKSGNDAQELERLLALMRKEADADEEDAETDEEEEDSRSDNKIDQNIKDYIMGILSRHEPKSASKKGKGKAGKDPETDDSETAETAETEDEVRAKIDRLPLRKGLSVRTALVYDGELPQSLVSHGFFDFLIPASDLLGLPNNMVRQ